MNKVVKAVLLQLHERRPGHHQYVFTRENGEPIDVQHVYRDFLWAMKRAKMEKKIRFHDLRHTFASHFMMKTGRAYDLQKILGHTDFKMTQVYAHISLEHLVEANQLIHFGGVVVKQSSPFIAHREEIEEKENVLIMSK